MGILAVDLKHQVGVRGRFHWVLVVITAAWRAQIEIAGVMAGDRMKAAFSENFLLEVFLAFAAQLLLTEASNSLLTQISISLLGHHYDARGGIDFVV
jgi:hypothetical protein